MRSTLLDSTEVTITEREFWLSEVQIEQLAPFLPSDRRYVVRVDDRMISGIEQMLQS